MGHNGKNRLGSKTPLNHLCELEGLLGADFNYSCGAVLSILYFQVLSQCPFIQGII